jgi:hypothetical protein
MYESDAGLDNLLDLDGYRGEISSGYWVKFDVRRVEATPQRPHGLKYSLTLHSPDGNRILGFDNSHSADSSGWNEPHDHVHLKKTTPYQYTDAADLLQAFWTAVENELRARGVI